ncbi:AzlC family ABC transporter permease [Niallia sp. 01092]|uniref:AzlC family ABC transporter permease n=1 Tax=unclassified Niallia TaxID=2837522 RepID=UPI003FCF43A5
MVDTLNTSYKKEAYTPTFSDGIKDCIPTLLGYISIGIAMGIVGVSSGLNIFQIFLMSTLVYAGSAQFIICAMLAASSPISAIILTTFIVNLRHLLLSSALAPSFRYYSLLRNIGIGSLVTDESFGVAIIKVAKKLPISDRWMNGLNLTAYIVWIISCSLGAYLGGWLPDPKILGFDFALPAMFIALLILQLQTIQHSKLKHYVFLIILMIICMLLLSSIVSGSLAVILSTIIVASVGVVTEK